MREKMVLYREAWEVTFQNSTANGRLKRREEDKSIKVGKGSMFAAGRGGWKQTWSVLTHAAS